MTNRLRTLAAIAIAAAVATTANAQTTKPTPATPAATATTITAVRILGTGPINDAFGAHWRRAMPAYVPLLAQTVALPHNDHPAVTQLTVRAVHNGTWIAFLIEWKDDSISNKIVLDNFGDQVAIQLPIDIKATPPSPMMGNPGGRVNIIQWRAAFQHDLDAGPPTTKSLYPNSWVDVYPDEVLTANDARPYSGALGLENPISRGRATPVLDQFAEGWGSMTVKPDQHALGSGVHRDGRWHVVITRPMASDDQNAPRLAPGDKTVAAFAVWEGSRREVGARKAWSSWMPVVIGR